MKVKGDKTINRIARLFGPCTYLFQGKTYQVEKGKLYATRMGPDGKRSIVQLVA